MADELEEQGRIALQQRQMVDQLWKHALDATANPPPDPGFARRLLAIADAAEQQAAAFRLEDSLGFGWRSKPGARNMQLSYELRPGAPSRPGPIEQWERFDSAVAELGTAFEGVALSAIARGFARLSDVARELAAELDRAAAAATRRQAG